MSGSVKYKRVKLESKQFKKLMWVIGEWLKAGGEVEFEHYNVGEHAFVDVVMTR